MNWLTHQLALMPQPDVILHIGAGLCSELPEYQQIEPSRIILIEPNPETFNALRQKTADCGNVTVLQAAVAAEAGRARLHRFNFPELDSLREPTGLYQLLPGLQQIGQTEVSTISPAQLVRRLNLADSNNNWLILEAPGEETAILEELARIEALQHFSRLIVRTGAEPLYEGDSASGPLLERLESFGYFVEAIPDENDPDWPRFHLKYQPLALKCRELETQLEATQHQLAETTEKNHAKANEADELKSRIAELEKERDELDSTRRELSKQAEASARELDQAKAEWNKERQALEAKKTEEAEALNTRIENLEKQRHKQDDETKKLQEKLAQTQSELSAAEEQAQNDKQNISDLEQKIGKMEEEHWRKEELIDDEFLKAESQLDLIKELMFRDKSV